MEIRNEIRPVDVNNMDGQRGATAAPVDWPEGLSRKATQALLYLDGAAFLFLYRGDYIITDESGLLTETGKDYCYGGPRAEFRSLNEIGPWLEELARELEDFGIELPTLPTEE